MLAIHVGLFIAMIYCAFFEPELLFEAYLTKGRRGTEMRCLNCGNPSVGDYCSVGCAEEHRRVTKKASELLNNALPALPGGYIARSEVEALIESRVSERTKRLREAATTKPPEPRYIPTADGKELTWLQGWRAGVEAMIAKARALESE